MSAETGITVYKDAAGQMYLHLPLVPTVAIVALLLIILVVFILITYARKLLTKTPVDPKTQWEEVVVLSQHVKRIEL